MWRCDATMGRACLPKERLPGWAALRPPVCSFGRLGGRFRAGPTAWYCAVCLSGGAGLGRALVVRTMLAVLPGKMLALSPAHSLSASGMLKGESERSCVWALSPRARPRGQPLAGWLAGRGSVRQRGFFCLGGAATRAFFALSCVDLAGRCWRFPLRCRQSPPLAPCGIFMWRVRVRSILFRVRSVERSRSRRVAHVGERPDRKQRNKVKRRLLSLALGLSGLGALVLYVLTHPVVAVLATVGQQARVSDRAAKVVWQQVRPRCGS